jgi:hypothetical protein
LLLWIPTGWWFQTFFIFHFIYGMSSFPLTFIFFRGVGIPPTTNQPRNDSSWRFLRCKPSVVWSHDPWSNSDGLLSFSSGTWSCTGEP